MKSACSIHGRFQPFHNGHLQYFRWARERYDLVYVGITQIYSFSDGVFPGAAHRGVAENNPFTFFDRRKLIEAALVGEGFDLSCFRVIPFPIEDISTLPLFMPLGVPCCTTIHTEWNEHKIKTLRDAGYQVEVLSADETGIARASGSDIRKRMKNGDETWRQYVPKGVATVIETEYPHLLGGSA